ncbi:Serine/threonine-protein phosphatase 6 regulatory ankyrin repeat subunit A [Penicillium rolfsii]|nr:Serine/threonine-protein phosphatase 6 regulatory ankyrin repeat subunit A [Penicillium rolfsii]
MIGSSEYTIGWLCALPCEYAAAELCLDEKHVDVSVDDNDEYILGRIGKHNVVIAVLPMGGHGTTSATAVAKDMCNDFKKIRVVLMVGIGGGVPTKRDIRLGDVVVSAPDNGMSGVFQYDYGKSVQDQAFVNTGFLDQPPVALRIAMSKIQKDYLPKGHDIEERLNAILSNNPQWRLIFSRPDPATDLLFESDRTHDKICGHGNKCVNDQMNLVPRRERSQFESITIHYGTIASGNQVMKNAVIRDKLSIEKDVLCFEMEAAGLMNHFPCAVIRGICDYSDSHKNDQWQGYAALTAALYTKDLLSKLSPGKIHAEKTVVEILSKVETAVLSVESKLKAQEYNNILKWFATFDYGLQLDDHLSRRAPETGGWFLESAEFKEWLGKPQQLLFCPGIPGAGKTMIASIMVYHLRRIYPDEQEVGIAFTFLDFHAQLKHNSLILDLLRGLLKQLIHNPVPDEVTKLYEYHTQKKTYPSLEEARDTLFKVMKRFSRTFIVLDGLDEIHGSDGDRMKVITELFNMQDTVGANIAVTSRPIPEMVKILERSGSIRRNIRATEDDVRRFIDSEMRWLQDWIRKADGLERKITDTVMKTTDGMQAEHLRTYRNHTDDANRFLLARLHLNTLRQEISVANISETLTELAAGSMAYNDAYDRIMERISKQPRKHKALAIQVLSWITRSHRPIRIPELQHALAVSDGSSELNRQKIPPLSVIVEVCAGLITFSERLATVQLVHYTTSEYFEKCWTQWFPDANQYMATVLINYLSFDQFSDPFAQNWIEYHEQLRLNSLYDYAARYWGEHAREEYPRIRGLVAGFLRKALNLVNSAHVLMVSNRSLFILLPRPERVTGLHVAAYFGILEQIRELIGEEADPDVADSSGQTALHWAVKNGQLKAIEVLFNEGLDMNARNAEFETPLHHAAIQTSDGLVEFLISLGSQIEARNSAGETPLLVAAKSVNLGALKGLLGSAANPNALDNMDRNALHLAILASKKERQEAVKMLLSYGVDFRLCDAQNMTPLHYAVAEGKDKIVDLLLEAGADINMGVQRKFSKDSPYPICTNAGLPPIAFKEDDHEPVGLTPLHFAACAGHSRMTEYLINKGADPNARCYCLDTPLHVAIRRGLLDERRDHETSLHRILLPHDDAWTDNRWNVEVLKDHISDYESEEADEVLEYVEEQRLGVVKALLQSPTIDVNPENIQRDCPLHLLRYNYPSTPVIVSELLDMGADVSVRNGKGESILHLASAADAYSIVGDLLDRGVSIETTDYQGLSALHSAIRAGSCKTLRTIFRRDEDSARGYCISVDAEGRTLLHHYLQGCLASIYENYASSDELSASSDEHFASCDEHFTSDDELSASSDELFASCDEHSTSSDEHFVSCDEHFASSDEHFASCDENFASKDILILLLSYGAKVECTDNNGHTPLSTYLSTFKFGNRAKTCKLLLERGANALWNDSDGRNLAHLAVSQDRVELGVLKALSDYGLDLSRKDRGGRSIIHHGAISGSLSLEIATFLHERNLLDLYSKDSSGKTPLDYALEEAYKERPESQFASDRWKQTLKALQSFC